MSKDPLLDLFNGKGKEQSFFRLDPDAIPKRPPAPQYVNPRIELLNSLPSKVYNLRGTDIQCYTIGAVAKVLGKSDITIRSWEQKGWMPLPKVRTAPPNTPSLPDRPNKGRRLYSRAQVEYLIWAFEDCNLDDPKNPDWDGFRQLLHNYPAPA